MTLLASIDWHFLWEHRSEFVDGLENTLKVSGIGIAGAFAIGLVLGAARAHRIPIISQLAAIYV
jgi:ABC-type amino acid transport system permease subunit